MHLLQLKSLPDQRKLFDKMFDGPERDIIRLIRIATPKLVVKNNRSLIAQSLQRLKIIVWSTGTSVQHKERNGFIIGANNSIPYFTSGYGNISPDQPSGILYLIYHRFFLALPYFILN